MNARFIISDFKKLCIRIFINNVSRRVKKMRLMTADRFIVGVPDQSTIIFLNPNVETFGFQARD